MEKNSKNNYCRKLKDGYLINFKIIFDAIKMQTF